LVEITAMTENLYSHKYDGEKGTTIGSAFLTYAGYSSFNQIQKFVGFPEVNFLFRESSQVG